MSEPTYLAAACEELRDICIAADADAIEVRVRGDGRVTVWAHYGPYTMAWREADVHQDAEHQRRPSRDLLASLVTEAFRWLQRHRAENETTTKEQLK